MVTDGGVLARWRRRVRAMRRDVLALYLAARNPRVPWHAKLAAACVAAYALSPVDLTPDFVPVLGYLDDLVIVPLGILLAVRLVPPTSRPSCGPRPTGGESGPRAGRGRS